MYWSIHWSLWINKWSTVYPAVVWYWVVINGSNKLWFYLVIDPMKRFWYLRPWLKTHLKFSMIGQVVKMTFKYRCLLNRGDHMDRLDCNIIVVFVLGVPWNMETVSLGCKYWDIKLSFLYYHLKITILSSDTSKSSGVVVVLTVW